MGKEYTDVSRSIKLLHSFYHVQKSIMRLVQKTAVENGLTVPQYTILLTVAQNKEISQKRVGEITFFPKSTLSQAVDGLAQSNYLTRKQMEGNRREMQLMITDEGIAFLKSAHHQKEGFLEIFQTAILSLSNEQYDGLLEAHQQIASYLELQENEKGENDR